MKKIISQSEPGRLLHVVVNTNEPFDARLDISDPAEWMQVSVLNLPPARKVNPHVHQPRAQNPAAPAGITQECWVILRGKIKVRLFDLDQKLLHEETLSAGHLLVTFYGGHALECDAEGALMVECKNGPYLGRDYTGFEPA